MQMKGRRYAKRAQRPRPAAMAAPGEVSRRGGSAAPAPTGPGPTASLSPGVLGAGGEGAAAAGHPRGHLLRGDGQRHRPAPGPALAGGGGRGRRRLPVSGAVEAQPGLGGCLGCRNRWEPAVGAPCPPTALASPTRCWQVLVLLHRGGEPAALVFGASPQVVPGCGLLPGRAE